MRRPPVVVLLALVLSGAALAACSSAGSKVSGTLVGLAEGSWTCRQPADPKDQSVDLSVNSDGKMTFTAPDGNSAEPQREKGGWKVVDRDVEVSLGKSVARIIDGEGLGVDAGQVTVEVAERDGSGKPARYTFDIVAKSNTKVEIVPSGKTGKLFPNGAFNCSKR